MLKPVKNFVMVKMVTTPQVFTQLDFLRTFRPYDDIIKTGSCQNNDFLKRIFLLNSFYATPPFFEEPTYENAIRMIFDLHIQLRVFDL